MEYGMAFFFRIANQPVVKLICPDTGEMLVHQMLADADIQGAHQHILFLSLIHILEADINPGGIAGTMNVEYDFAPELDLDLSRCV